ncbi:helix-turn-helix domain-containing protein [Streptomyces sp. CC228A]|uniref:helix-turn-helix domain-containing protein n=1 Tax=Streptomyces sp. CC228A TaxID=2898186 RepID=UPI001F23980A|nr:helix-turn-helix transcriptional regulator [Streptomyces sp. CC228A]
MTTDDSATRTRAQRFGAHVAAAARAAGYDIDSPRGGGKKALAERSGMSHASVSRMLAGQTIPDPTFFEPLAEALGLNVAELLVLAGVVSEAKLLEAPTEASRRAKSPREAAADLGITDPSKVHLFEAMVRALISGTDQQGNGRHRSEVA